MSVLNQRRTKFEANFRQHASSSATFTTSTNALWAAVENLRPSRPPAYGLGGLIKINVSPSEARDNLIGLKRATALTKGTAILGSVNGHRACD
jgi:hypothetical protein